MLDGTDMNDGYRKLPAIIRAASSARLRPCARLTLAEVKIIASRRGVRPQLGRHRQHRDEVGHESVTGASTNTSRRRARFTQRLQSRAAAQERLPQPAIRRIVRRSDSSAIARLCSRRTRASASGSVCPPRARTCRAAPISRVRATPVIQRLARSIHGRLRTSPTRAPTNRT